jgi:endonuclease/exonuclease/phosphatase family metal-dependent hydrolase
MFSVLNLNLRFGLADDGDNSWGFRKRCFPVLFKKYHADFIGFQEANDFQIEFLDDILKAYGFIGKRNPSPSFWQNNIIFYKHPWHCLYHDHFYLSHAPTVPSRFRDSLWPRQCTIGVFKNGNRRLIYINTHFDFDVSVQVDSAKLILEHLSKLPTDIPVILAGDFNAPPSSPCYNIFTRFPQTTAATATDVFFKNAFSKPYPGTHHGFSGDLTGEHIDWILYSGNIIKKDGIIIQEPIDGVYPSDHFPLYATFEWAT